MKIEIGSNFWLAPEDVDVASNSCISSPGQFGCRGTDFVWLSTGRSAISWVIDTIRARFSLINKVVCVPAFTCHTVYEPFMNAGYKVVTMPVDWHLCSRADEVLDIIRKSNVGVVLFHHYFGFRTFPDIDKVIDYCRENGILVIEDCTQSLYSSIQRSDADFFIGSIRKWCGVPDGGFAVCRDGVFYHKPQAYDIALEVAKRIASELKYEYIFHHRGDKDTFLAKYRKAEDILSSQTQYYAISRLAVEVQASLDIKWLKNKRRDNFKVLSETLGNVKGITPVFDGLGDDIVPLYFPILCDVRKDVQCELVKNAVYAPIVWPKADNCPPINGEADYLYNHLLCIPIDQRYDADDMQRIAGVFLNSNVK